MGLEALKGILDPRAMLRWWLVAFMATFIFATCSSVLSSFTAMSLSANFLLSIVVSVVPAVAAILRNPPISSVGSTVKASTKEPKLPGEASRIASMLRSTVGPKELLTQSPLFAQLAPPELDRLASLLQHRHYQSGETVFREGDPGTALYLIEAGEVKVLLAGSEGKEVPLSLLSSGEFFGELALLDGEPRSADAVATMPTELLVLLREDFLRFLREEPMVAVNMLAALSRRFRRTDRLMHDAVFSDVRTRVTRLLIELAETQGKPASDGVVIGARLTQRDLANMVGATRETINKCLRYYAAAGLVRHQHGRLVLPNVERLRQMSEHSALDKMSLPSA